MERTAHRVDRKPRRRRSALEWKKEVKAWKASGLSAAAYAAERDLKPSTMMWWAWAMKRERRGGRTKKRNGADETPQTSAVSFLPLRVVSPKERVAGAPTVQAEILLQGGRRVRVAGAMNFEQLAQLLAAVEDGVRC